jgi:hypothetical protein
VADLDLGEIAEGKFDLDVAGHYARPDVFRLIVNERQAPVARFDADGWDGPVPEADDRNGPLSSTLGDREQKK